MSTTIEIPWRLPDIDARDKLQRVRFTANHEHLISISSKGPRVWRVADGKHLATMLVGFTFRVAASNDGRWIAGVVKNSARAGTLFVWDATTYEQADQITSDVFRDVDFSPDSTHLLSACGDGTATIRDVAARQNVRTLDHGEPVSDAKYSPQGDRIVTATKESVRVWDSNDGRLLVNVKVPLGIFARGPYWCNNHVLVAINDTFKVIDTVTGSTVSEWSVPNFDAPQSWIAVPPRRGFVACHEEKTITIWDIATRSRLASIQHTHDISSIDCSSDGQLLAIAAGSKITVKDLSLVIFNPLSEPKPLIDGAVLDEWKRGQFKEVEGSLSEAIPKSVNRHHVLASRSLVRARLEKWDVALADASKSLEIQQSPIGYIAKCVALVGNGETDSGCQMCDIASQRFPSDRICLLLVKAIVLFMAGKHVDAILLVDDLIAGNTHLWADPALYVVQAYMHFHCGNLYMESSDYERAIQSFEDARIKLGIRTRQPPLIVSLISGWRDDHLAIKIRQRHCDALFAADRIKEASESVLRMADPGIDMTESAKTWVSGFKSRCRTKLEDLGDSAANVRRYDEAITQYTAALSLDRANPQGLLMKRSNAWVGKDEQDDALNDAKEWIKLMLTSRSWKDALTDAVGFMLERSTIYWVVCEHLRVTGRVTDAMACFRQLSGELAHEMNAEKANWIHDFESSCRGTLEDLGDSALNAKQYDEAVSQYTAALLLDPPDSQDLLVKRSKAYAEAGKWKDALNDANEVIKLGPSSPLGYERKYAALLGMEHNGDTRAAFDTMLSEMSESSDPDIRERSRHYVRPDETKEAIRTCIKNAIRDSPLVLIHTSSGRLCDKSEQAAAFESTPGFITLVASTATHINHALIERVVREFYRYAMFSHTWEGDEPLYEKVIKVVVYELEESPTHEKLKIFCKVARDAGFVWAWSDTCCIDQKNPTVLQESIISMFKWYEGSGMTIIYLCDVDELAELGALIRSRWNSRGWTLLEYQASKVIRIYTKNWKPYLGLTIHNYKESPKIISEMEQVTGLSAEALKELRPGLKDVREKLRLASTRQTTRVEDAAYSLFGIFSMALPVDYGDGDKALGRLLSQVFMGSGDTSILAWTGTPGSFNSCLPANIDVFSRRLGFYFPLTISDDRMKNTTAELHASKLDLDFVARLYGEVNRLPAPTFAGQRMKLPCFAFKIELIFSRLDESTFFHIAEVGPGLGAVEIRIKQNFTKRDSLYLVIPWIDFLLDRRGTVDSTTSHADLLDSALMLPSPSTVPDKTRLPFLARLKRSFNSSTPLDPALLPSPSTVPRMNEIRLYQFLVRLKASFGVLLFKSDPRKVTEYRRVATKDRISFQVKEITSATLKRLIQSVQVLDVV